MGNKPNQTEEKGLDRYEKLVGQAHDEIAWIRSVYKWVFGCITILFLFGVTLAVIFIGKDSREIKSRLNDEVDIVRRRVIDRIDEEFKQENIHELIVNRVDVVADELIGKQVENKIDQKIKEINIELENLKTEIAKFQEDFAYNFKVQKNLFDSSAREQDEKQKVTIAKVAKQKDSINQLIKVANTHTKKLREMIELAEPPELRLSSEPTIQKVEAGYEIKLNFDSPKDKYLGTIAFEVQVVDASAAKILNVSRAGISMNVKLAFTKDRKKATFQYSPMRSGLQQIKIQVSGTCELLISGNYLAKPFNIVVK